MSQEIEILKQESLPVQEVSSRNKLEPSDDTLRELGEFLRTRFRKLKDFRDRSQWEQEKAYAFDYYHMAERPRQTPFDGAANFTCPLPRVGVDSFHANVMGSIFTEGRIKIVPVLIQKEFANTAGKAAEYMTYCFNQEANFYIPMDDGGRKALNYGGCYLEPTYEKEEIWETVDVTKTTQEPSIDPLTGEVSLKEKKSTKREKKKKTVFDGLRIQSIPIENIYKSPFFLTLEQAVKDDAVFKTFPISLYELKERGKKKKDKPAVYYSNSVDGIGPYAVEKMKKNLSELEQARANNDGFYFDLLARDQEVEMAEGYCWWDIDNDGYKEEIKATFHPESGLVVKVSLSKCRIVDIVPFPIDGRGEGEGIPKICKYLSDEWEMFHNTRVNAGQWENMPFFFYRSGGRFNPQQYVLIPGHGYPVDDPREVSFPRTQRVGSSYFQEEQMITSMWERIFGLDENMQGVGASRRRTATEALKVSSRATIRFGTPFNRFVMGINKLINHAWELNRECAPEDKEFYVVGEGGAPLFNKMTKYEYSANMKFAVAVQSVFDQQMVRDTMLLTYRLFIVNPIAQQRPEIIYSISQKTLDALNVKIDLPKPEQAKVLSPFEEHEMFLSGEDIEPKLGEDTEHHLKIHMLMLNAKEIKDWDMDAVKRLVLHIDKTKIQDQTLKSANLNASGHPMTGGMPPQPNVTTNRNPTQAFNTMRVNESGNSQRSNANAQGPKDTENHLNQVLGSSIS